jgi:hypothetical protein
LIQYIKQQQNQLTYLNFQKIFCLTEALVWDVKHK